MSITRELIYKNIDQIMANAEKVNSKSELSIKDLLTDDFLKSETKFNSLSEMFSYFGKEEVCENSFNEIPDEEWETFIYESTPFESWEEMFTMATSRYIRHNVFSGIL